jgi:phage shock protein E
MLFVDVREPYEYALGHIEGAISVPSQSLMQGAPELKDVPKDTKIIVYCRSGSRSAIAIEIFKTMGFSDLINGINQFRAKELSMQ